MTIYQVNLHNGKRILLTNEEALGSLEVFKKVRNLGYTPISVTPKYVHTYNSLEENKEELNKQ